LSGFYENLLKVMVYVLPSYVANATPVVAVKIIGRSTPIDRGLHAWDGRRLFGDGKTVEGLLSGIFAGTIIGILIYYLAPLNVFRGLSEPLLLSVGAMGGDIFGSFVKRRLGMERGKPLPILDQLGFLIFSLLFSISIYGVPEWLSIDVFLILLLITFILHITTNMFAYLIKLKDKPY